MTQQNSKSYREDVGLILYHITLHKNLDNILCEGLIPMIGERRLHSRDKKSTDKRISLCKREDLDSWKKVLYKGQEKLAVLEVCIPKSKTRYRKWKEGFEFGYWERIPAENIKLIEITGM